MSTSTHSFSHTNSGLATKLPVAVFNLALTHVEPVHLFRIAP